MAEWRRACEAVEAILGEVEGAGATGVWKVEEVGGQAVVQSTAGDTLALVFLLQIFLPFRLPEEGQKIWAGKVLVTLFLATF